MEERVFAELTKQIAAAPSRRGMVRALTGGVAAAVLATMKRPAPVAAQDAAQDVDAEFICRPAGVPCGRKQQCCARKCVQGTFLGQPAKVCGCWKKGHDCIKGVGKVCCSGKCNNHGKCK